MKILGFSGYKESGKDDSCDFLVRNAAELFGFKTILAGGQEIINIPKAEKFYYADDLKKLCIDILGLDEKLVYGSNADKDRPSGLLWENMPGVITDISDFDSDYGFPCDEHDCLRLNLKLHAAGEMTVREVLQFVGTEIFRKMYENVWVDAFLRRVRKSGVNYAFVSDVRFSNEVEAIKATGGKVIRLTRDVHKGNDRHESELVLSPERYNWSNFDYVLDNENMTRGEKYDKIVNLLVNWRWINQNDVEKNFNLK